jgi:glucose-1-phosphate thymidylyltransferase
MAGYGTRLRPHTWSKPKPLVSTAGKAVLGHILDQVNSVFDPKNTEIAFIIGYHGEQVKDYMRVHYPQMKTHYYVQQEMKGQSHAIAMARQHLHGPTLILFVDTIIDSDMSFLHTEKAGAVIWVKEVEDPRRFGVVDLDENGWVKGMIEKPDTMENNLAIVGYYYFARGEDLMAAIDRQLKEDIKTKGEYFLANAMCLMLDDGLKMRPEVVDVWLDAGLPETILQTNRYLLQHGSANNLERLKDAGVQFKAPCYIHPEAKVANSEIGPFVSIAEGCQVSGSTISNSVLEAGAQVENAHLRDSIIGARAQVRGVNGAVNIGDDAAVIGK